MRENSYFCTVKRRHMKKIPLILLTVLAAAVSCKPKALPPRPTIPLVESIANDTTGLAAVVAAAGSSVGGSIAIIGEPSDGALIARLFQGIDVRDNIDGRALRDSLPDFAGEHLDVILDSWNAPYRHFQDPDSLREMSVRGAMFAWDSTAMKDRAKVVVLSSPLASAYGLFDVDTLQQLCGGKSFLVSPVSASIDEAVRLGAHDIGVWASREVRASEAYESAFREKGLPGSISAFTPDAAMDSRTSLRSFLRQYRAVGKPLDALILAEYGIDRNALLSEIRLIRGGGTEEDRSFSRMIPDSFVIVDPGESLAAAVYAHLREKNPFTPGRAIGELPLASFPGEIVVVDAQDKVFADAVRYLRRQGVLGFDTETRPTFSPDQHSNGTALLQLSGPEKAFLFRVQKTGLPRALLSLLSSPSVLKVGAATADDVKGLQKIAGFTPKGFLDLQSIVWEYGIRDKSVKKMAAIILGVKISKAQQLSNWEAETLSESQRKYAATDAWVCREMYRKLSGSKKHPLTEEQLHPERFTENG